MLAELEKAWNVSRHPGMSGNISLPKLMWQAVPYLNDRDGYSRPPLTIYWSVNSVCNLHCKMCDVAAPVIESNFARNLRIEGKFTEIPIEKFRSVIDEVASTRPMISITATEPLMYKPLGEAVSYARKQNMQVAVTTGGYLLPKRAVELAEAKLSRLVVSIDGHPELHNSIRGKKDSFQRSIEGITLFKETCKKLGFNGEVLINFTISNLNYDALVSFYEVVSAHPIDRINFTYMNFVTPGMAQEHNQLWGEKYKATTNCLNEDTQPDRLNVDVLHEQMMTIERMDTGRRMTSFMPRFNIEQLRRYFYEPAKFMGSGRCMVNWFIAQIIASGEVIPYTRCYHIPLGSINDSTFMDVWNGERARAWRRELREQRRFPACTRCDQVY